MSRKFKKILATGMILLMSVTAGCGSKSKTKEAKEQGFCADISVYDCLEGPAFCDKGIVKVEKGLMIFYEYETGKSYPLCSDAYCEHLPYDEKTNPDPVCEATLKDLEKACIHGDYVYAIQNTGIQEITVQARNLKESGYRVVATLPYCQAFSTDGYNAIIGNKAYLLLGKNDNPDEEAAFSYTSNDLYTYLVELNLETGEYKTLFHTEGVGKYKVLQTVYGEDGIYCRCYYEDIENAEDPMNFKINEYRERFCFVSYDGSEVKELCPELVEMTAVSGGALPKILPSGINMDGAYLVNKDQTKIECYRYDGGEETVFELPEEYNRLSISGIGNDFVLITLMTPEQTYRLAGLDLNTKELTIGEEQEFKSYEMILGEAFWIQVGEEEKELWLYEDYFSGTGQPLLIMTK